MIYRGDVQGVGFRWRTVRALEGLALTGYVRNRSDGTVELVVEAPPEVQREALARVRETLGGFIRGESEAVAPATGEFAGFTIRR